MTDKVWTIAGEFDRKRLKELKKVLKDNQNLPTDSVIKFEGQDLIIRFGQYLVEFVEKELNT